MKFSRGVASAARAAVAAAAAVAMSIVSLPSGAGATENMPVHATTAPTPAFYTYQAPGGSATAGRKVIALTFDDGPGQYTPQVLSILEQFHVPATFFEIGIEVNAYPQYTKMVAAAGYPVEDHTWSHANLATLPISQFPFQIDQTQARIQAIVGIAPSCVRPPFDAYNSTSVDQLAQRGLTMMSYSIDPKDWTLPGTQAIVGRVVGAAFPGAVVDLHDAGGDRSETVGALPQIINDLRAQGYSFVSICGTGPGTVQGPQRSVVLSYGSAPSPGSATTSDQPFVGAVCNPAASGYWLASADGGVFGFGNAPFSGSLGKTKLARPIVGIAATRNGRGYWMVGSDGGVFTFGNAGFYGSTGAVALRQPIVAMVADPATGGYWLVASDGGVFAYHAPFYGSLARTKLARPIVAMAAAHDGKGYWLVASDGGVFSFGSARFRGSLGAVKLAQPIVGMSADPLTGGYWLAASDGGVFSFDAPFYGAGSDPRKASRFFAVSAAPSGRGYLLAGENPVAL